MFSSLTCPEKHEIYFETILNEYYDTEFFEDSAFNLSLLKFVEGKEDAIELFEQSKDNYTREDNYNESYLILNELDENEKITYYIKHIK